MHPPGQTTIRTTQTCLHHLLNPTGNPIIRSLCRRMLAQLISKLGTHYTSQVHIQLTLEFLNTRERLRAEHTQGSLDHSQTSGTTEVHISKALYAQQTAGTVHTDCLAMLAGEGYNGPGLTHTGKLRYGKASLTNLKPEVAKQEPSMGNS